MRALLEIVADGGASLGYGHVGRCLALADELGEAAAFSVEDPTVAAFLAGHGARVGGGEDAPVVLLDRRAAVTEDVVRAQQARGRRVALLDDLGPARMLADLVIDPPTAAAWPPAGGTRVGGFEHVLIRRELRDAAAAPAPGPDAPVLLGMGGSDPAQLTAPLAAALDAAGVPLRVALGPGYTGPRPVAGETLGSPRDWPLALRGASLLVSGYGQSLVEAAYLGVAAVAVVFLPEHLEHAEAFCAAGTAVMLDMTEKVRAAELVELVTGLLADTDGRRAELAARGTALVDGGGAARVAAAIRDLAAGDQEVPGSSRSLSA